VSFAYSFFQLFLFVFFFLVTSILIWLDTNTRTIGKLDEGVRARR
jgi:hypothetical protein